MISVSTSLRTDFVTAEESPESASSNTTHPPQARQASDTAAPHRHEDWRLPFWSTALKRANPLYAAYARLQLSRAKHRSLAGHPRIARRLAGLLPGYRLTEIESVAADGAPDGIQVLRRISLRQLGDELSALAPRSIELSSKLQQHVADAFFVDNYRVPFQFRELVRNVLPIASVSDRSEDQRIRDVDGNWMYDLGGSYGVNLFGAAFYKRCINRGVMRADSLGLALGPYHPVVLDNVERLRKISGLDEISFHMSGTEAVMQAVRVARYHTGRSHVVRFAGAYHGWWDGVQAGPGNPRPPHEVYTLEEMSEATLKVLESRTDIACVLVNPIQAMHPNMTPPSDGSLIASNRSFNYDKQEYGRWLAELREICTRRKIVLIFDEVFLGFRVAKGGVQEYFSVRADLVTYGKTLGGGLPVGALAGKASLMRRFDDAHPANLCFARGTFNAHPYVMTCMNEFLRHLDSPAVIAQYEQIDRVWNERANSWNKQFSEEGLPIRVHNLASVWSVEYTMPSRFNWMMQFYLRAEGISLAWIGTGRLIFSHDITDSEMKEICTRFVAAGRRMQFDGWWWRDASLTNKSIRRRVLGELIRAAT